MQFPNESSHHLVERTAEPGFGRIQVGLPFMINSEPMAGGSAPVTLAGCLVLANADVPGSLALAMAYAAARDVPACGQELGPGCPLADDEGLGAEFRIEPAGNE